MKYYKLKLTSDKKSIGKYPQSLGIKNVADVNKVFNLGWEGPIKSLPTLPQPVLDPKAYRTTFLNIHINKLIFLVVKINFTKLLSDFDIECFQTWSIEVEQDNEIYYDYELFHISTPIQDKLIDFHKSEFLVGQLGDWKNPSIRKPVELKNYSQYINLQEVLESSNDKSQMRCNKLVLDLSDYQKDIFRLSMTPYFGNGYYVSERLKKAMEKERFTGMQFKEIEHHYKKIKVIY